MNNETIKSLLILMYQNEFDINNHVDLFTTKKQEFEYHANFEYTKAEADIIVEIGLVVEGVIYKDSEPDYFYNPLNDGRCGENQGAGAFIESWEITDIKVYKNDMLCDIKIDVTELDKKL